MVGRADVVCETGVARPTQLVPCLDSHYPHCRHCACPVDPVETNVRYYKKGGGQWQCGQCSCRLVGLVKIYGTSNMADFDDMPEASRQEFWKSLPTSQKGIRSKVEDYLVKTRTEREANLVNGELLPLSVYKTRGVNTEDIEKKTLDADKEWHPVLGMTYKVKLRSSSHGLAEEHVRKQMLSSQRDNKKIKVKVDKPARESSPDKSSSDSFFF